MMPTTTSATYEKGGRVMVLVLGAFVCVLVAVVAVVGPALYVGPCALLAGLWLAGSWLRGWVRRQRPAARAQADAEAARRAKVEAYIAGYRERRGVR